MSFRFRKSVKLMPGVKLNIGKRGISTTVGTRGAKVTFGPNGRKTTTVGIPGTGLSHTSNIGRTEAQPQVLVKKSRWRKVLFWLFCFFLFCYFLQLLDKVKH